MPEGEISFMIRIAFIQLLPSEYVKFYFIAYLHSLIPFSPFTCPICRKKCIFSNGNPLYIYIKYYYIVMFQYSKVYTLWCWGGSWLFHAAKKLMDKGKKNPFQPNWFFFFYIFFIATYTTYIIPYSLGNIYNAESKINMPFRNGWHI